MQIIPSYSWPLKCWSALPWLLFLNKQPKLFSFVLWITRIASQLLGINNLRSDPPPPISSCANLNPNHFLLQHLCRWSTLFSLKSRGQKIPIERPVYTKNHCDFTDAFTPAMSWRFFLCPQVWTRVRNSCGKDFQFGLTTALLCNSVLTNGYKTRRCWPFRKSFPRQRSTQ